MLIGTYRHSLDEKKRMRVPSKFKEFLGSGFVITKGNGGCLFAFCRTAFDQDVVTKTKAFSMFDSASQKPLRMLMASAFETEEDNQGRILLPQELRDYAQIKKQIVFIGVGNRMEIWAEEVWNAYSNDCNFDEAVSELAKLGV